MITLETYKDHTNIEKGDKKYDYTSNFFKSTKSTKSVYLFQSHFLNNY